MIKSICYDGISVKFFTIGTDLFFCDYIEANAFDTGFN